MSVVAAVELRVLHALPNRLRVQLPPRAGQACRQAEDTVLRVEGVTKARVNLLTDTILIHFNPQMTDQESILPALRCAALRRADIRSPSEEGSTIKGAPRLQLAATCDPGDRGGELVARNALDAAVGGLAHLQSFRLLRNAARNLLGPTAADLLFVTAELLSTILSRSPLTLAGIEALLLLGIICSRRATAESPLKQPLGIAAA